METNEIREAILKKAREEAEQILSESRSKAADLVKQAKEQKQRLVEEEKGKKLAEARREAAKILAQSELKERQIILGEKDGIIKDILARVRDELQKHPMEPEQVDRLLGEILQAFETDGAIRLFVAGKDLDTVRKVIDSRDELKNQVAEVKERPMLGGIYAETTDGMISIDNTYDRRLEMLMPRIMPEIGKNLFGG